jgi:hypothetical protein
LLITLSADALFWLRTFELAEEVVELLPLRIKAPPAKGFLLVLPVFPPC